MNIKKWISGLLNISEQEKPIMVNEFIETLLKLKSMAATKSCAKLNNDVEVSFEVAIDGALYTYNHISKMDISLSNDMRITITLR